MTGVQPCALPIYDAVNEARTRALAGQGPTLIEAHLYRLGAHTTADDPTRYVPAEELEEARRNDPIDRLRVHLLEPGLWDDEAHSATAAAALARFGDIGPLYTRSGSQRLDSSRNLPQRRLTAGGKNQIHLKGAQVKGELTAKTGGRPGDERGLSRQSGSNFLICRVHGWAKGNSRS